MCPAHEMREIERDGGKEGAEKDRWPIEPGIEHNRMSQRHSH